MSTTNATTNTTFNFAVSRDGADVALFISRADAEAFARTGEEVGGCAVSFPWEEMSSPRKNLAGEAANSPEEVIGVW